MSVLPASSSYESLGGTIADYDGVVDPTTDLPADADSESRANVAAMTRTARRVSFVFTNDGTTATVTLFDSVAGNAIAVQPGKGKQATGWWRFTFPASVTDLKGGTQAWSFRTGHGSAQHNEPVHVQVRIAAPNIVDVYMWAIPSGAASDVAGVPILVEVS
jgi:hypothetical protein